MGVTTNGLQPPSTIGLLTTEMVEKITMLNRLLIKPIFNSHTYDGCKFRPFFRPIFSFYFLSRKIQKLRQNCTSVRMRVKLLFNFNSQLYDRLKFGSVKFFSYFLKLVRMGVKLLRLTDLPQFNSQTFDGNSLIFFFEIELNINHMILTLTRMMGKHLVH